MEAIENEHEMHSDYDHDDRCPNDCGEVFESEQGSWWELGPREHWNDDKDGMTCTDGYQYENGHGEGEDDAVLEDETWTRTHVSIDAQFNFTTNHGSDGSERGDGDIRGRGRILGEISNDDGVTDD